MTKLLPIDPRPSGADPKARAARKQLEKDCPHISRKEVAIKGGALALITAVALFPWDKELEKHERRHHPERFAAPDNLHCKKRVDSSKNDDDGDDGGSSSGRRRRRGGRDHRPASDDDDDDDYDANDDDNDSRTRRRSSGRDRRRRRSEADYDRAYNRYPRSETNGSSVLLMPVELMGAMVEDGDEPIVSLAIITIMIMAMAMTLAGAGTTIDEMPVFYLFLNLPAKPVSRTRNEPIGEA